eukprot:TRINITY_DN2119_c0_g1_i1.p1 TRINITY_DN2119_c0_g1~~TRINITY_DN2119_c0_g1_i1.p1  ORF type:complete len:1491 (+),score=484.03 TRINITY_DN2119_c0_g1_i1:115-4587(+)
MEVEREWPPPRRYSDILSEELKRTELDNERLRAQLARGEPPPRLPRPQSVSTVFTDDAPPSPHGPPAAVAVPPLVLPRRGAEEERTADAAVPFPSRRRLPLPGATPESRPVAAGTSPPVSAHTNSRSPASRYTAPQGMESFNDLAPLVPVSVAAVAREESMISERDTPRHKPPPLPYESASLAPHIGLDMGSPTRNEPRSMPSSTVPAMSLAQAGFVIRQGGSSSRPCAVRDYASSVASGQGYEDRTRMRGTAAHRPPLASGSAGYRRYDDPPPLPSRETSAARSLSAAHSCHDDAPHHRVPLLPLGSRIGSVGSTARERDSHPSRGGYGSYGRESHGREGSIASSVARRYANDLKFIKLHAKNFTAATAGQRADVAGLPAVACCTTNFDVQTTLYQVLLAMAPNLHLNIPTDPFRFTDRELVVTRGRDTFAIATNKTRTLRELHILDEDVLCVKRCSAVPPLDAPATHRSGSSAAIPAHRNPRGGGSYLTIHVRTPAADHAVPKSFATLTTLSDLFASVGDDVDAHEAAGSLRRLEVLHRMCVWDLERDGGCTLGELKIADGDTIELRVAEPAEERAREEDEEASPASTLSASRQECVTVTLRNAAAQRSAARALRLDTKLVDVVFEGFELDPRQHCAPLHEVDALLEPADAPPLPAWDAARYRNYTLRELGVADGDTLTIRMRPHRARPRAHRTQPSSSSATDTNAPNPGCGSGGGASRPAMVPVLDLHGKRAAVGPPLVGAPADELEREERASSVSGLELTTHQEPQDRSPSPSPSPSPPLQDLKDASRPSGSPGGYGTYLAPLSPHGGSGAYVDPGDTTDTTSRHSRTDAQPSVWLGDGGLVLRGSARVGGMLEVELDDGEEDLLKLGAVTWYSVNPDGHRVFCDSNVSTYVVPEQDYDSYIEVEFTTPEADVYSVASPAIRYLPSIENAEINGPLVAGHTVEVSYDVSGGDCTVDIEWEVTQPSAAAEPVGRGRTLTIDPAWENNHVRCHITPILLRGRVRGVTTTVEHPDVVRGDRPVVRGLELTTQEVDLLPGGVVEPWADLDYNTAVALAAPLITWTIDSHTYEGRTYTIKPNDLGKRLDCSYKACTADGKESEVATAALFIPWVPLATVALVVTRKGSEHPPHILCALGWEVRCDITGVQNLDQNGNGSILSQGSAGPAAAAALARPRKDRKCSGDSDPSDEAQGGKPVRQDTPDDEDILHAGSFQAGIQGDVSVSGYGAGGDRFYTWSKSLDGLTWTVVQASASDVYTPTPDTLGHILKCDVTGVYHAPAFTFVSVPPELQKEFLALLGDKGLKGFNVLQVTLDEPVPHKKHLILTTKYLKMVCATDRSNVLKSKWTSGLRLTCSPTNATSFTLTTDPATPPMELSAKSAADRDALAVLFRCFHAIGMPAMCMEIFREKVKSNDDRRSIATWEAVQTPYEVTIAKIIKELRGDAHFSVSPLPPPARAILNSHREKGEGWLQAWLAISSVARGLAAARADV